MNLSLLLGAKAEIVFGSLLVVRNSAVRLTCVLALTLAGVLSIQDAERFPGAHQPLTAFLVVGTLAAVAGSRLFAPGPVVAASRRVAAKWWLVPLGRLTGALLVVLPVAAVPVFSMELADVDPVLLGPCAVVYAAAVASFSLSLAPAVGSSSAVAITLAMVWVGTVPTTAVHALLERWPMAEHTLLLLRNTLPLTWRADRILTLQSPIDASVLLGWIIIGILTAGWATTAVSRMHRKSRASE